MPCFYLSPEQDNLNQELQICIAEALYDVDSIVADPGAYTKEVRRYTARSCLIWNRRGNYQAGVRINSSLR